MKKTSELLKKLFQKNTISTIEQHYNSYQVVLKEAKEGYELKILNVPSDLMVINIDDNFNNNQIFQGNDGECKRCDFVLISEAEKIVLFIELKKSNNSTRVDKINQLKGGLCFIKYTQSIVEEFFNYPTFLKDYKFCYAIFDNIHAKKRPTKLLHDKLENTTPEKAVKISKTNSYQFKKLVP